MLEPPALPQSDLLAALRSGYGLDAFALEFLPLGNDASAWVYRADAADEARYFIKIRQGPVNQASLALPRYLHDQGVPHIVAPLPTRAGALWATAAGYNLTLYPFIDGPTGREAGLSDQQWVDFGAALRQIHAVALPAALAPIVRREDFHPKWAPIIADLDAHIGVRAFADPAQQALAVFWRARRGEIRALVARAEALGRRRQAANPPLVVCHADAHTANVLIDRRQQLWIVDWDEALLAPIERDLMFIVNNLGDLHRWREAQLFFRGYGVAPIEALGLAYYHYE